MRYTYLILFFLLGLGTKIRAQDTAELERFFLDFKEAAADRDVMRLNGLIYPFKYADSAWNYRLEDVQDQMLQGALRGDSTHQGNGAFSLPALDCLIGEYLDDFTICAPDSYKVFCAHPRLGKVFPLFRPEDIFVFKQLSTDTHILVFRTKTGLQLLAWKNLNALLTER